ncbi:MAG: serine/threonine-protein kinase [Phycisphaerales bacterium]|nr:serine/threonine-protein kinase [Phycisphaerales bacterium]
MSNESYPTPAEIFGEAIDMPEEKREAFLVASCGDNAKILRDVHALIKAYETAEDENFLNPQLGVERAKEILSTWDVNTLVGLKLGAYQVIEILGEGGMGVVFRAQQASPNRTVALKVVRPGLMRQRLTKRFELEAEMLGRLQHIGIAQIYESGTADTSAGSQPFFAMELVEGQPLLDWSQTMDCGLEDQIEVLIKICDAVQHAHLRGVIHRDLKPSNILIDQEIQPKILDFGIARMVDLDASSTIAQTHSGQVLGTLQYMSPEQCIGNADLVDARTDIYALGAILYQLITRKPPRDLDGKGLGESLRIIEHSKPAPPEQLVPGLPEDINTIVMKTMDLDPNRRYQSAAALGDDLRRFLKREPITARPPTLVYYTTMFVRRNRLLAFGSALVIALLIVGMAVAILLISEINLQHDRAAEAQQNFMTMIESTRRSAELSLQSTQQEDAVTRLLQAASQLDKATGTEPLLVITNRNEIGLNLKDWEAYEEAKKQFQLALDLSLEVCGADHPLTALSQHNLASALWYLKDYEVALDLYNQALRIRDSDPNVEPGDLADTIDYLGSTYQMLGDFDEARALAERSRKMKIDLYGAQSEQVAATTNNIGWQLMLQKKYAEAEPHFRESLEILQGLPERQLWIESSVSHNLAYTLMVLDQAQEAESLFKQSLDLKIAQRGPESLTAAMTYRRLAELFLKTNQLTKAREHCQKAIDIYHSQGTKANVRQEAISLMEKIHAQINEAGSAPSTPTN